MIDVTEQLLRINMTVAQGDVARADNVASEWIVRGARCLLLAMHRRIGVLLLDGSQPAELRALQGRFEAARRELSLFVLNVLGRSTVAMNLAREFHDFGSLVELVLSGQPNERATLDGYIAQYGQSFAFELFKHFVSRGERHRLFATPPYDYVDEFLDAEIESLADVAWMHDLRLESERALANPVRGGLRLLLTAVGTPAVEEREVRFLCL